MFTFIRGGTNTYDEWQIARVNLHAPLLLGFKRGPTVRLNQNTFKGVRLGFLINELIQNFMFWTFQKVIFVNHYVHRIYKEISRRKKKAREVFMMYKWWSVMLATLPHVTLSLCFSWINSPFAFDYPFFQWESKSLSACVSLSPWFGAFWFRCCQSFFFFFGFSCNYQDGPSKRGRFIRASWFSTGRNQFHMLLTW